MNKRGWASPNDICINPDCRHLRWQHKGDTRNHMRQCRRCACRQFRRVVPDKPRSHTKRVVNG